jgi:hypothetical protein
MTEENVKPEWIEAFRGYSALNCHEQMKVFLKAFFRDPGVDVDEVFKYSHKFHFFNGGDDAKHFEMEEDRALKFMESLGNTKTALQLRKELKAFDMDRNNHMSLVEFLMLTYNKTVAELFSRDVDGTPELLEALRQAKAELKARHDEIAALEAKAKELETATGVKAFAAKTEIAEINDKLIPEVHRKIEKDEKNLAKAQKAVEDDGSAVEKLLVTKGLTKFVK